MEKDRVSAVAKFSSFFIRNSRVSFLILIGILILGFFSYNTFLKREGFPAVQVPIVFIQTPYFVEDESRVDLDITSPVEEAIADIKEVTQVTSTTTENFSNIVVEFEQDFSTKEGSRLIRDEIQKDVTFPENVKPQYRTFNAGALDGTHDLLFTISGDRTVAELQEKAGEIAEELETLDQVAEANVVELVTQELNPLTGEEFSYQSGFNRIGIKEDGNIEFSEAVAIGVVKKGNLGTLEISDAVRNKIDDLRSDGQLENLTVTYGGDFADSLRSQINALEENAFTGLLAVIIVVFFLIGWRASIVAAIFIPTVAAGTFLALYLIGYTLNVITLFSLILVLGLIVDDAVVVIEAIDYQKREGKKGIKAITSAISDIGPADIAGTLTTILVFLPMAFVSGLLGEFIRLMPITVIIALIISITVGLSLTTFLSNIILTDREDNNRNLGAAKAAKIFFEYLLYGVSKFEKWLSEKISSFTKLYLRKWPVALLILFTALIWIGVGISYSTRLSFAVFPPAKDSDQINVFLDFPSGVSIEEAEDISKDAETIVIDNANQHIETINYFEGSEASAFINVQLTPIDSREITAKELVDNIQADFENFVRASVRVEQSGVGPPADEFQINLQVFAEDESTLISATNDIRSFLDGRNIEGENIEAHVTEVVVDNIDNISKRDGERFAAIKAKISDPNNTAAILTLQKDIQDQYDSEKLASLGLDEDALGFDLGQEGENVESFESAVVALGIALLLMYALLVFQFNSFSQPLLIFMAIPFTFPLLFPGLYLTNNSLSFFVMLGIIALAGIVVNNTIFLVDYANQARRNGLGLIDSIAQAVQVRFRPIIATTVTTILALLPLTMSDPFWESLGYTIIFGLASSAVLVIFAFPVFYAITEVVREIRDRVWTRVTRTGI